MSEWCAIGILAVASMLTGIGHVCFKLTAIRDLHFLQKLRSAAFIGGLACFVLGAGLAVICSRYTSFWLLYGMSALNVVFILFLSRSMLNESIDSRKILGATFIIVGLGFIAFSKS